MSPHFNFLRKIFHLSGLLIVIVYFFDLLKDFSVIPFRDNTRSILFYFLFISYLGMLVFEFLRFKFDWAQKLFLKIAGKIIKPEEAELSHGSLPFFLGLALCTAFFMKEVTIIAFLSLMIGDPAAAYVGIHFGKHKIKGKKSLEGFLAGTLAAFFSAVIFVFILNHYYPESFLTTALKNFPFLTLLALFLSSLAAFTGELFSTRGFFDDNLVIPLLSGLTLSFLLLIFFQTGFHQVFYSLYDLLIPLT